ncbi:MAG: hypothetical protein Q3M24_13425 [Candidatus Electrothrix aestuarii]|uniref:Uncharacterized protein n=1 Tax=Candidatus Electrothrix aestuarii TaxID=3062594 RepID=A0AAU8LPW6_9BACT|nr:hypothetical protein [Candidatus Electrothrix aestuarii]WPD24679.1 MAG: hypothetical protein SD837_08970 [Candidatus Electrothrix sp. GW3-3]
MPLPYRGAEPYLEYDERTIAEGVYVVEGTTYRGIDVVTTEGTVILVTGLVIVVDG